MPKRPMITYPTRQLQELTLWRGDEPEIPDAFRR